MATTIKNVLHVSTGPERGRQAMASAGQDRAAGTYGQTIAVGVRVGVCPLHLLLLLKGYHGNPSLTLRGQLLSHIYDIW